MNLWSDDSLGRWMFGVQCSMFSNPPAILHLCVFALKPGHTPVAIWGVHPIDEAPARFAVFIPNSRTETKQGKKKMP
jgi:hypothetical protein